MGHDHGNLTIIERLLWLGVTTTLSSPLLRAELGVLAVGAALLDDRHVRAARDKEADP